MRGLIKIDIRFYIFIIIVASINITSFSTPNSFAATDMNVNINGSSNGDNNVTNVINKFFSRENIATFFDLGSAIFSTFILIISLVAYKNLKSTKFLLIVAAFGMFLIRSILSHMDIFHPETTELLLSVTSFVGLFLLFFALIQLGNIKLKKSTFTQKKK